MHCRTFETFAEMRSAGVDLLCEHLAGIDGTLTAVILSGGNTPYPIYAHMAQHPVSVGGNVRLIVSDERMVPEQSADSNFGRMKPMISALRIPDGHILKARTDLCLEDAAARYHDEISAFISAGGRITMAFLGLGADGHTASLFSDADIRASGGMYAVGIPHSDQPRISLTPGVLRKAESIVFLVAGPAKESIVRKTAAVPEAVTAGRVVSGVRSVQIWYSREAGG